MRCVHDVLMCVGVLAHMCVYIGVWGCVCVWKCVCVCVVLYDNSELFLKKKKINVGHALTMPEE